MAHHYSSAPPYGAQYPTAPYYSPFAPSAGHQMINGTSASQTPNLHAPMLQTPPNIPNIARYDANANIQTQPAPSPFLPHFNPEFLKHFPPPPPPPLSHAAHYIPAPGTAPAFATLPQSVPPVPSHPAHQHYSYLAHLQTPTSAASIPEQHLGMEFDQRDHNRASLAQETEKHGGSLRGQALMNGINTNSSVGSLVQAQSLASPYSLDDHTGTITTTDRIMYDPQMQRKDGVSTSLQHVQHNNSTQHQQMSADPRSRQAQDLPVSGESKHEDVQHTATLELKERAKAALLSLVPYNIRYDSFIAEGVSAEILQQLYKELGLSWKTSESRGNDVASAQEASITRSNKVAVDAHSEIEAVQMPASTSISSSTPVKTLPTIITPVPQALPPVNVSMERKDRIAQLLAAKAGKTTVSGTVSKSLSPTPVVEQRSSLPSENDLSIQDLNSQNVKPRVMAQSEVVRQRMEQLRKDTITRAKAEPSQYGTSTDLAFDRPAVGENMSENRSEQALSSASNSANIVKSPFGSLIPGLFMTSAEMEADGHNFSESGQSAQPKEQVHALQTTSVSRTTPSHIGTRKRSAEHLSSGEEFQTKRQALPTSRQTSTYMEVDDQQDDDPSEGEIVEEQTNSETDEAYGEAETDTPPLAEETSHDYVTKKAEIEAIRKRISELEQRQSLKRGSSFHLSPTGSAASTPTFSLAPQSALSSPLSKLPDQGPPAQKLEDRTAQNPRSLVKATPEQIAERAAQLKADFLRQRALRQKQLQDGIPVLDNEVAKSQSKLNDAKKKLAQIQQDIATHEENVLRARESEKQLLQEVERLEKQISDGVSGQKQFSNELSNLDQQNSREAPHRLGFSKTPDINQAPKNQTTQAITAPAATQDNLPSQQNSILNATAVTSFTSSVPGLDVQDSPPIESPAMVQSVLPNDNIDQGKLTASDDQATRDGSEQSDIPDAMESHLSRPAYTLERSDNSTEDSEPDSEDSRMSIDEDSDNSASMSDSGSDDYEPAEPDASSKEEEKVESDEYEPQIEGANSYNTAFEDEVDDYEPAEDLGIDEYSSADSMPQSSLTPSVQPRENNQIEPMNVSASPKNIVLSGTNDQKTDPQPSEAEMQLDSGNMQDEAGTEGSHVLGAGPPSSVRYQPYQSPLSSFKSYRFHPSFNKQVKDGYRSLTYSHKIDSKVPFCQSELSEVPCTDPGCQDQHFNSMALPDDKILVQMSSASDIKDKDLRAQYLIGLKHVIARLRQEGVKEFSAVADALSQYRREWTAQQMTS